MKTEISLERQRTLARGERMQPADEELTLQGAVVDVDETTGLARSIQRVSVPYERVLQGEYRKK
jgi:calcineurin-like phosphoesterase